MIMPDQDRLLFLARLHRHLLSVTRPVVQQLLPWAGVCRAAGVACSIPFCAMCDFCFTLWPVPQHSGGFASAAWRALCCCVTQWATWPGPHLPPPCPTCSHLGSPRTGTRVCQALGWLVCIWQACVSAGQRFAWTHPAAEQEGGQGEMRPLRNQLLALLLPCLLGVLVRLTW